MRRAALIAAGALVALVALLPGVRRLARSRTFQLFGTIVPRVETSEPRVALTFDDGPSAAVIDTLLAMLEARDVNATFFVTGQEMAAEPAAARRLVAAGHQLGNHTYTHQRMIFVRPRTVRREIAQTDSLIRAAGFDGTIPFRPPYGYKLITLPWHLSRTGRATIMWDIEPDSYREVAATPDGIVRHVLDRVRPGSIILLHVWYPSRATSLAAVGPLIDSLHARGYVVGTVRDLMR